MTTDERVDALAEVLHDWVGGCCVNRFDDCVFGGSGVREEAARLLAYPAMRALLSKERARALCEAANLLDDDDVQVPALPEPDDPECDSWMSGVVDAIDWLRARADREVQS